MKLKQLLRKGIPLAAVLAILFFTADPFGVADGDFKDISLTELQDKVATGQVKVADIDSGEHQVKVQLHDGSKFIANIPNEYDDELTLFLIEHKTVLSAIRLSFWGEYKTMFIVGGILLAMMVLPFMISSVKKRWFVKKKTLTNVPKQTFDDVLGVETLIEDIDQLVDYLKNPQKYKAAGIEMTRGLLFWGSPGTGKTLLARAIAGTAGVQMFALSGSDFAAKFYGQSEGRVEALFKRARKFATAGGAAIIVIDEIDAVGSDRDGDDSSGAQTGTLNKLLTEMDGFLQDENSNVVVIGITNRKEALDGALLRPGRLTTHYYLPTPDANARIQMFMRYASRLTFLANEEIDYKVLARRTTGMSGADIAKVCNSAGLLAIREGDSAPVTMRHFALAIVEHVIGHKRARVLSDHERNTTAYHEAGHALVTLYRKNFATPEEVSIIPRGDTGGATILSHDDRSLLDREYIESQLIMLMGARAAERMMLGDNFSTGAAHDLEQATKLLIQAICKAGMGTSVYAAWPVEDVNSHPSAREILQEVEARIQDAENKAGKILEDHRKEFDAIVAALLDQETISGNRLRELAGLDPLPEEAHEGELTTVS